MPSVSPRLVIVQECVVDIWESRGDGRGHWLTLERTLIEMLAPTRARERRTTQRRSNVIRLSDYLERRRLADRRATKPP